MLAEFIDSKVSVVTNDGRHLVGFLRGADQVINIVLEECQERIYSDAGVEQVPLGLFIVRGDNVAAIGEIDEAKEDKIDFSLLRGTALPPVVH